MPSQKKITCPHCEHALTMLSVSQSYTAYETQSGTLYIESIDPEDQDLEFETEIDFYDNVCDETDDYGDIYYNCPECRQEISITEVMEMLKKEKKKTKKENIQKILNEDEQEVDNLTLIQTPSALKTPSKHRASFSLEFIICKHCGKQWETDDLEKDLEAGIKCDCNRILNKEKLKQKKVEIKRLSYPFPF